MSGRRYDLAVGLLASAGAVALASAGVAALRPYVPVLSLGVLYLFAVLGIAVGWGIELAVVVSVASMLAFNWFFLPPEHTFQLRDGANWLALAVYLVTAVVVSSLATRARHRAEIAERHEREAAVLAQLARDLLAGAPLDESLDGIALHAAHVLGAPSARLELGTATAPAGDEVALPVGGAGTLYVPRGTTVDAEAASRFLPALGSLLAVEVGRAALQAEALEAEALRRSDALKTALLRSVSHDLRSPLTAILTGAGALANTELDLDDADRAALVDAIREEAERLDRVVRDLLDISRLEAGRVEPHLELWTVDEIVARALESVGGRAERVVVELDPNAPPVRVDAAQMERVLANLIDNALKFSPSATPVVVRVESGATEVRVHVVDRGPGIAVTEREAAFEPCRGSGLGLAIARGFAVANDAHLWVQDDPAGGHLVVAMNA